MRRTPFKPRATPVQRPKARFLRKVGISPITKIKTRIQAILRAIVIKRDKTCVLRHIRGCTDPVIQADHLVTRGNSATFANTRLIVALCRACHGGWKQWHKDEYDDLVKTILPKDRIELWEREEARRKQGATTHYTASEWLLIEQELKRELATYD